MTDSKAGLEAWKRADADARIAEARLLAVWDLYEKNLVAAPDENLLREVSRLRAVASTGSWARCSCWGPPTSWRNGPPTRSDGS